MKRTMLMTLAALLLLLLLPRQEALPSLAAAEGVLRLHILANSDSREDQALKLRVRDALLPLFAAAARPSTIEAHSIAESQLWKSRK